MTVRRDVGLLAGQTWTGPTHNTSTASPSRAPGAGIDMAEAWTMLLYGKLGIVMY